MMENHAVYRAMLEARARLDAGKDGKLVQSEGARCIAFRIDEERYLVELASVKEVIVPPAVLPVPGAPAEILGVINLRGSVLTVVNSRIILGLEGCPGGAAARILVLDDAGGFVGVLVDSVEDIVRVDDSMVPMEVEPGAASTDARGYFRGAMNVGEHIAFVISPAGLAGSVRRTEQPEGAA